ncbi:MAG: hypothetical protein AB7T37_06885 [Dehalococcoidia bacterium]
MTAPRQEDAGAVDSTTLGERREREGLRYVEVRGLKDGRLVPECRVWEDGRFEGGEDWYRLVSMIGRDDPLEGGYPMRGPGLLRRVLGSLNNMLTVSAEGEVEVRTLPARHPRLGPGGRLDS